MRLTLATFLISAALIAQTELSFTPPVLGYFYDEPARKLKAIVGLPGAARAVEIEASALPLDGAWPAPGADYALAAPTGEDSLVIVRDLKGAPAIEALPGVARQFEVLAYSPGGRSAALFSAACACVQVLSGLPSAPILARVIERSDVTSVAVSDDAVTLAISGPDGVELVHPDGTTKVASGRASIAMAADGTLAVAEVETKSVRIVRPGGESLTIMAEGDGLSTPLAVGFDRTGRVIAADDAGGVHVIAADGAARASAPCDCKIDTIEPAFAENLFRVAKPGAGPIWMLDARSDQARVFFVPVPREEVEQ